MRNPARDIFTKEHRNEARKIASESFVLLKNQPAAAGQAPVLPLAKKGTVAVIGPLANTRSNMPGTWSVAALGESSEMTGESSSRSNYLDVDNEPLYPFGYGLSYTSFQFSDIALSTPTMGKDDSVTATVTVTNTGKRDGAEVVQLYIRDLVGSITRPVKELKGFEKIFLRAGESKTVTFKITPELLRFYNYEMKHVVEPGDFDVMIGGNSQTVKTARLTRYAGQWFPFRPLPGAGSYDGTGKVKPFGQKDNGGDLVETAFIMQALSARIDKLWREVDWNFYRQNDQNVLYWHWSPEYGWEMNFPVRGYNECLIMYILADASPTHGVPAAVYHDGWAQNGAILSPHKVEDIELHLRYQDTETGPLFWAHYSFFGLNPTGLKDMYCAGLLWKLFMSHPDVQQGLNKLGYSSVK